jgi:Asp-tRNA(Asn)/Glu-tRNA(Gln) amidotransferase A subunit family amidase
LAKHRQCDDFLCPSNDSSYNNSRNPWDIAGARNPTIIVHHSSSSFIIIIIIHHNSSSSFIIIHHHSSSSSAAAAAAAVAAFIITIHIACTLFIPRPLLRLASSLLILDTLPEFKQNLSV